MEKQGTFYDTTPSTVLDGVAQGLLDFVDHLAAIHQLLFGIKLVITSGKDGKHAAGSLHGTGHALDIRTHDKTDEQMDLLLHVISYATASMMIACFDERNVPGGAHLHIEWHAV